MVKSVKLNDEIEFVMEAVPKFKEINKTRQEVKGEKELKFSMIWTPKNLVSRTNISYEDMLMVIKLCELESQRKETKKEEVAALNAEK